MEVKSDRFHHELLDRLIPERSPDNEERCLQTRRAGPKVRSATVAQSLRSINLA